MCFHVVCILLCLLPPLSLHRLSSNYSLPSSTQNSPLPSTRHHRLENTCGDRVWTRLTLVLIWTLELCQAALEGIWSDWRDPFLGCCGQLFFSCLFIFSRAIFYTFLKFSHVCRVCSFKIRLIIAFSCLLDKWLFIIMWWSN